MDSAILMQRVMIFIPLVLSLTVHEYGHAWSAYRLGDDTAARAGRLSLNPLVHMDLLGTVILPLLGIPFGWAKPVPVNPVRFRRDISMTTGMMLTAAAGPIMNVLIAVASTVAYALAYRFKLVDRLAQSGIRDLLEITIALNVSLAIFNLIPVPPLDGSRIVDGLIPTRWRGPWEQVVRLSPFLLLAVIWFGSSLIAWPSEQAIGLLRYLFHALAT